MWFLISIILIYLINTQAKSRLWNSNLLKNHYRRFRMARNEVEYVKTFDFAIRALFLVGLVLGLLIQVLWSRGGLNWVVELTLLPTAYYFIKYKLNK